MKYLIFLLTSTNLFAQTQTGQAPNPSVAAACRKDFDSHLRNLEIVIEGLGPKSNYPSDRVLEQKIHSFPSGAAAISVIRQQLAAHPEATNKIVEYLRDRQKFIEKRNAQIKQLSAACGEFARRACYHELEDLRAEVEHPQKILARAFGTLNKDGSYLSGQIKNTQATFDSGMYTDGLEDAKAVIRFSKMTDVKVDIEFLVDQEPAQIKMTAKNGVIFTNELVVIDEVNGRQGINSGEAVAREKARIIGEGQSDVENIRKRLKDAEYSTCLSTQAIERANKLVDEFTATAGSLKPASQQAAPK